MKTKNLISVILLLVGVNSFASDIKSQTVYVDVIKSEPIYKTVNIRVPYEEVVSKAYEVSVPCGHTTNTVNNNSIGLDTIIGAGLGVVLGNQVGKGNGRTAAKIAGGLLGAGVANNYYRQNSNDIKYCKETRYKDEVVTRYEYTTKEKLQGYKNTFIYNGHKYTKITHRPKKTILVRSTISF